MAGGKFKQGTGGKTSYGTMPKPTGGAKASNGKKAKGTQLRMNGSRGK